MRAGRLGPTGESAMGTRTGPAVSDFAGGRLAGDGAGWKTEPAVRLVRSGSEGTLDWG